MYKKTLSIFLCAAFCLTSCASIQNSIADMQNKNLVKKMPDGSEFHFNTNLTPAPNWGCKTVGTPQSYAWDTVETQAMWKGSDIAVLTDNAADYLTKNDLHANYVNLKVPATTSIVVSQKKRSTEYDDLTDNSVGTVVFYNCKLINPSRQLGTVEETTVSARIIK